MTTLALPVTGTVSGLTMAQDMNAIAAAVATMVQGGTAPTTASTGLTSTAGLWWHDTTNKQIKVRNQADTAWIVVLTLDETNGLSSAAISSINGTAIAGNRNRVINGNFGVNQRTYVSATATAAGVYMHDRWRAGAGGCTYTFTAGVPDTQVTLTAGSVQQAIEAGNIEGGTYTLSWTGSAVGRVGTSGAFAGSPITVTGVTAGTQTVVEFQSGTLGLVQVEPGAVATPFERRMLAAELQMCQRYFQTAAGVYSSYSGANPGTIFQTHSLPVRMCTTPTVGGVGLSSGEGWTSAATTLTTVDALILTVTTSQVGEVAYDYAYTLSAEL